MVEDFKCLVNLSDLHMLGSFCCSVSLIALDVSLSNAGLARCDDARFVGQLLLDRALRAFFAGVLVVEDAFGHAIIVNHFAVVNYFLALIDITRRQ